MLVTDVNSAEPASVDIVGVVLFVVLSECSSYYTAKLIYVVDIL